MVLQVQVLVLEHLVLHLEAIVVVLEYQEGQGHLEEAVVVLEYLEEQLEEAVVLNPVDLKEILTLVTLKVVPAVLNHLEVTLVVP